MEPGRSAIDIEIMAEASRQHFQVDLDISPLAVAEARQLVIVGNEVADRTDRNALGHWETVELHTGKENPAPLYQGDGDTEGLKLGDRESTIAEASWHRFASTETAAGRRTAARFGLCGPGGSIAPKHTDFVDVNGFEQRHERRARELRLEGGHKVVAVPGFDSRQAFEPLHDHGQ